MPLRSQVELHHEPLNTQVYVKHKKLRDLCNTQGEKTPQGGVGGWGVGWCMGKPRPCNPNPNQLAKYQSQLDTIFAVHCSAGLKF